MSTFVLCPSCPTQQAARELFFSDDVLTRLGAMFGPFIVTAGLIALFVNKLERHWRLEAERMGEISMVSRNGEIREGEPEIEHEHAHEHEVKS